MIVHRQIIQKAVYDRLAAVMDQEFESLFKKYKNDPEYVKYENDICNPRGMEFNYCRSIARSEAWDKTIGREVQAAKARGQGHPDYRRETCGCCDNMVVTFPIENANGDYEITVDIEPHNDNLGD